MKVTIDRIENDTVVLELQNGKTINAPRQLFENAMEADIYIIKKDCAGAKTRHSRITKKINKLFID
jgi:hypothetical protein